MKNGVFQNLCTANLHYLKQCNLSCEFCYAHFYSIPKEKILSLSDLLKLALLLKTAGFIKLNLAGGEPLIYPEIAGELIKYSSEIDLKTSIVTNGTLLKESWLKTYGRYLNWIAISCDSADEETQKKLGRGTGNQVSQTKHAFSLVKNFNAGKKEKEHKIHTKLNSVITRLNGHEDMSSFLLECKVVRWKILQVLLIEGENDSTYPSLAITPEEFKAFVLRHKHLENHGIKVVSEDNELMIESYVMIDPQGRFFQNRDNRYQVSSSILEVGVQQALQQVGFSEQKFLERGGVYAF